MLTLGRAILYHITCILNLPLHGFGVIGTTPAFLHTSFCFVIWPRTPQFSKCSQSLLDARHLIPPSVERSIARHHI